jgi:uncharacterized membrane protein
MWVGATYYFTWLDRRFHTTDPEQVWMVHSGGFYVVRKEKQHDPAHTLHWFKWEAMATWASGVLLLVLVYYLGGLLIDSEPGKPSFKVAAAIGIAVILLGWKIYDLLWLSPIAKNEALAVAIHTRARCACVAAPRDVQLRGLMHADPLGTCMAANVWERIIPAQKKMVKAIAEGQPPDLSSPIARNSARNTTPHGVSVALIMISNHLPVSTFALTGALAAFTIGRWPRISSGSSEVSNQSQSQRPRQQPLRLEI